MLLPGTEKAFSDLTFFLHRSFPPKYGPIMHLGRIMTCMGLRWAIPLVGLWLRCGCFVDGESGESGESKHSLLSNASVLSFSFATILFHRASNIAPNHRTELSFCQLTHGPNGVSHLRNKATIVVAFAMALPLTASLSATSLGPANKVSRATAACFSRVHQSVNALPFPSTIRRSLLLFWVRIDWLGYRSTLLGSQEQDMRAEHLHHAHRWALGMRNRYPAIGCVDRGNIPCLLLFARNVQWLLTWRVPSTHASIEMCFLSHAFSQS